MKRVLPAIIALLLIAAFPAQASGTICGQDSLRLTMAPVKSIDQRIADYQPLLRLLHEGLGIPVHIVRPSSYASVIDAIVSGGVDLASLGPASYLIAHRSRPEIEAFAAFEAAGERFTPAGTYYTALLLVRSDSDIRTLPQARGVRVALNDPSSTSGALIPNTEFPASTGFELATFFGTQVYTGSHDKSLNALLAGKVDAAFVSSPRVDEYLRHGRIEHDTLHVLWASGPIHRDPFVFRAGLCAELKERIRTLMQTPSPELQAFLNNHKATAIAAVSHDDYRTLLQFMPQD